MSILSYIFYLFAAHKMHDVKILHALNNRDMYIATKIIDVAIHMR
jgi:hypothetical protein